MDHTLHHIVSDVLIGPQEALEQVTATDHTKELTLAHHEELVYRVLTHEPCGGSEPLPRLDADGWCGHQHLGGCRRRLCALTARSSAEAAGAARAASGSRTRSVSDTTPSWSAFGIHHRKGTDVVLRKQTLYLLEVSVRRDRDRITGHDIAHSKARGAPDVCTHRNSHCAPCISTG